MRADDSGFSAVKAFLRSTLPETVVALRAADTGDCADYACTPTPTTVRWVRVVTPNGRVHVVITSLLDATAYPADGFADHVRGVGPQPDSLYSRRHKAQTPSP